MRYGAPAILASREGTYVDISQLGVEPPPNVTDMRSFLRPDLVLTDRTGRDWTIAPPTLKVGAILAAAVEWGAANMDALVRPERTMEHVVRILTEHIPAPPGVLETAGRALADAGLIVTKAEVSEETQRLMRENADTPLEVLALGRETVDAMEAANVPGVDVQVFGQYAAYVWLYGEDVAQRIMRASVGATDEEAGAGKAPASEMTSGSGSRTASAPSSGTTSTEPPSTRTTTSRTTGARTTASRNGKRKRKR